MAKHTPTPEPIAIVAMAGRYPGAGADLDRYWANILQGTDCSRQVPVGRWHVPPERCLRPGPPQPDVVPHARSYTLDPFEPDWTGIELPADLLKQLDVLFHLVLDVGTRAWRQAKVDGVDRRKVGVILGNICLPTDKFNDWAREVLGGGKPRTHPWNRRAAGLPAGLLARGLGLGLGSYTLDAACASSLYALKLAADELRAGRADAMLAGGCARPDSQYTQMGFGQLRALSASGICRPFDGQADGLMVGEGAGIFVLKRLSDAVAHGDTILAVMCGEGLSNDLAGNMLAPASEGQLRAMRAAYNNAGWNPTDVDLIECHATGTPVGDGIELDSLRGLWANAPTPRKGCVVGSVKANVGHLLTGAGAAAVTKVLLALAHKTLPPQANFHAPAATADLGPFQVLTQPQPWGDRAPFVPRKAAVSGFGFGGVNAHVLLQEYQPAAKTSVAVPTAPPVDEAIAIVGVGAHVGPWDTAQALREYTLGGGVSYAAGSRPNGWAGLTAQAVPGFYVGALAVPLTGYRIPPKELEAALPQQLLALEVAAAAVADAKLGLDPQPGMGVFVGVTLDPNTTNFHLRWDGLKQGKDGVTGPPPLTADRTMGGLASIAASRIARAFQCGGPSFTVCSEETSSGRALELAVRALRAGEIDQALVVGVDCAGDPRAVLANGAAVSPLGTANPLGQSSDGLVPADGAGAVVLKRLSDAMASGERVYAVIGGVGSAVGGEVTGSGPDAAAVASSFLRACADARQDPAEIDYLDLAATGFTPADTPEAVALAALLTARPRAVPLALGASRGQVGDAGAAGPVLALVKTALALYHQILPPTGITADRARVAFRNAKVSWASSARFWLKDNSRPRCAAVAATGADGTVWHAVLQEATAAVPALETAAPLGPRSESLFVLEADIPTDLFAKLATLATLAAMDGPIEALAQRWFQQSPPNPGARKAVALVARHSAELRELIAFAQEGLKLAPNAPIPDPARPPRLNVRDRVFYSPTPAGKGKLAFVYPGSGNHFATMGRDFAVQFPNVLRKQQAESEWLRSQYSPDAFWMDDTPAETTAKEYLFGQVTLGTLTSDILQSLGVKPDAMVGISLGESAGLFGTRVWTTRDEMLNRIRTSTLFGPDLGPPYLAAQHFWKLSSPAHVDWVVGVLGAAPTTIRKNLRPNLKAYLLIVNSATECVVGGERLAVEELVTACGGAFVKVTGVTMAHCEVAKPVETPYRALHTLPTNKIPSLRIYSGAGAKMIQATSAACADSITDGLLNTIDIPAVVEAAYKDGIRHFIEVGPGASVTRSITATLANRPHLARALCVPRTDGLSMLLRTLAALAAERAPMDLAPLYARPLPGPAITTPKTVTVPVGLTLSGTYGPTARIEPAVDLVPAPHAAGNSAVELFLPPGEEPTDVERPSDYMAAEIIVVDDLALIPALKARDRRITPVAPVARMVPVPVQIPAPPVVSAPPVVQPPVVVAPVEVASLPSAPFPEAAAAFSATTSDAHAAFLRTQTNLAAMMATTLEVHTELLRKYQAKLPASAMVAPVSGPSSIPRVFNNEQCYEFAKGKISNVLGPTFALVDTYPTRVRLPDGPLMLVDRILKVEGEPKSLKAGRVITDHTVRADRWYLDAGRCPTSVTVESGQADLFLSGFLGIDFETKGQAVYRLLDAVVTFHRGLPKVGETIVYDIHIDEFFHQAEAWLFRFRFEATINGQPILTMANGIAGFFTAQALAAGQGIVHTKLDRVPRPGQLPADWKPLAPAGQGSISAEQVKALQQGNLAPAFGEAFLNLPVKKVATLPGGQLRLIDRVPHYDMNGGRFGIGFIRAEYDIHPNDWFLTCHFVDDMVMPGTLMYECCLHTLRTLLMRMGWIGEEGEVVHEPKPGVQSKLKCRGQVVASTREVMYEVTVKELGYGPEPYCIADALMYADGKPIVEITNMSVRLAGLTRQRLETLWEKPEPLPPVVYEPRVYDSASIMAYSNGKPSEAFGEPYKIFDTDRVIARLPGPPYQFLDRVVRVTGEPFVLKAGPACVAEYDVPRDAWYFEANRCPRMPFSVLLEIALQPCGWLAAYCGSALTSTEDLAFRNLGGKATQLRPVGPDSGTLTTSIKLTNVSRSAGMIIQHYDMNVSDRMGPVYTGNTYFGFFTKPALANQVGMPTAKVPFPTPEELAVAEKGFLPTDAPFPAPLLRMVNTIDAYLPNGGEAKLGLVVGSIEIDPDFWFFKAHFYQDPVWPGSLGLESFLQLLKYFAWRRWGKAPSAGWRTVAEGNPHQWTYRGQVLPTDKKVTVVCDLVRVDDSAQKLWANGFLLVDGRIIYQMLDFTLE